MVGRWIGIGLAVVVVGGGGFLLVRHLRAGSTQAAPQYFVVPASVGPVTVSVSGTGSIAPAETQTITPSVGGVVSALDVSVGQKVRQGQTLFTLADTQGLAGQVASDQASLANAESNLQNLLSPAVDPRSVEAAQLKLQQSQLALRQAQLTLAQAQTSTGAATRVASPVGGILQAVDVEPGQQVNAGTVLAVVQPSQPVEVSASVPAFELPYLPTGAHAVVSVAGVGGNPVAGTVVEVAGTGNGSSAGATGSTSSQAPTSAGGAGGACANASGSSGSVVVRLSAAPRTAVPGAGANVVFTPVGSAPACYGWSAAGTVTYPSAVSLTAAQAGTVTGISGTVGGVTHVGATLVTISSPQAQATLQQDTMAVQQAQLSLQQAQIAMEQTAHPQPPTAAAVAAAKLQLASVQDTLAQAEHNLADLVVRSPMNAIVTAVGIVPGENVGASTAAVSLESSGPLQAQASIDELSIGQVHVGEPVVVNVAAYPSKTYSGRVVQVAPAAVASGGVSSFAVDVALNQSTGLLAGMSDTVTIQVASAPSAVRVPAQAVTVFPSGGRGVVRVMKGGKPVPTAVKVGLVGAAYTQILSGVQPGMPVVAGQASSGNAFGFLRAAGGFGGFGGGGRRGGFGGGGPRGG